METQLAEEEATRARLSQLSERLVHLVLLLEAVRGNMVLSHVPQLSQVVRKGLTSPLAAEYCQRVWGKLAHSVFQPWTLGKCKFSLEKKFPWSHEHSYNAKNSF